MTKTRIIKGDILRFCEHYHGERFHAVLCDAPYEMAFMGREWDASGVSFDSETWRGISNLLHPGGFLFVFAGTINDDLISVAMRKAELRKYHCMRGWTFGSGFPKATRIDTQVDRDAGAEREQVGKKMLWGHNAQPGRCGQYANEYSGHPHSETVTIPITAPTTPLAKTWEGHRYGGQMLKPAIETVLVFSKPYEGRPVDCITETGAGALDIEGGRVKMGGENLTRSSIGRTDNQVFGKGLGQGVQENPSGRWPANFFTCHHPDCVPVGIGQCKNNSGSLNGNEPSLPAKNVYGEYGRHEFQRYGGEDGVEHVMEWDCVPECPVRKLGEQSGKSISQQGLPRNGANGDGWGMTATGAEYDDSGTAARYFFQSHWLYERLERSNPILYSAKASRKERDAGLDSLPFNTRNRVNPGGLENEPRWAPVKAKNTHPTVKPIALSKWLATLLLPPDDYAPRRLLVPFAGSGSEMIGAILAGWEEVVGVELLQENVDIARPRLAWWQQWLDLGCDDVDTILSDGIKLEQETPTEQLSLFD
jgi:site-specific DNA-methyltransferase (adenine-specific)